MREEVVVFKEYSELNRLQKEKIIESIYHSGEHSINRVLCDLAEEKYREDMNNLVRDNKYQHVELKLENLRWASNSQGWYFKDANINDIIKEKEFKLEYENAEIELNCLVNTDDYNRGNLKCYYTIYDKKADIVFGEVGMKQLKDYIKENGIDIPKTWEGDVRNFESKLCEEYDKLYDEITGIIDNYNGYYPEKQEIKEYIEDTNLEVKYTEELANLETQEIKSLACYDHLKFSTQKELSDYMVYEKYKGYSLPSKDLLEGVSEDSFENIHRMVLFSPVNRANPQEGEKFYLLSRSKKSEPGKYNSDCSYDLFVLGEKPNRDSAVEFLNQYDFAQNKVNKVEINRADNQSGKEGEIVSNGNGSKKKSKSRCF
jgi:hypothetical protein